MSETQPPRRTLRSIGAVFAGLVAVVALDLGLDAVMHAAGVYPPWGQAMASHLFLLAIAYRMVDGIVGGYIAARLAPSRPMRHALILGAIGVVLSIAGAVATWNEGPKFGPHWYPLALAVFALPCAWLGGKLHTMRAAHAA